MSGATRDAEPWRDGAPLLELRGVEVRIARRHILSAAEMTVAAGELLAVVGPNGAGKTTLVRAAAGLQRTSAGTIRWAGQDIHRLRPRALARLRAYVPQRPRAVAGMTVHEAVAIGRAPHIALLHRATQADRDAVRQAIARAGVAALAERQLATLSGGELQRAQIAVALAQQAPALIADEPTSQLDLGATAEVIQLLRRLADDGLAVIVVVHDLELAAAAADHVVIVDQGRTLADGPAAVVLNSERISRIWGVRATLEFDRQRRPNLSVDWLAPSSPQPSSTPQPPPDVP